VSPWKWIPLGLLLVLVVLVSSQIPGWQSLAAVGAGYVAKNVCSCVFVSERSFDACRADILPAMEQVAAVREGDAVIARVPLFARAVARHHPGTGCTLE